MPKLKFAVLPLFLIGAAASCGADEQEVMVPASSVAPRMTPKDATDRIADARCQHEEDCKAVGPGGNFASKDQCEQSMRADAAAELAGEECIDGVADRYLSACLAEVASRACPVPTGSFETLRELRACRTTAICLG